MDKETFQTIIEGFIVSTAGTLAIGLGYYVFTLRNLWAILCAFAAVSCVYTVFFTGYDQGMRKK